MVWLVTDDITKSTVQECTIKDVQLKQNVDAVFELHGSQSMPAPSLIFATP